MDNLPPVNVGSKPITSAVNKLNKNISQNKVIQSADFVIRKTGRGTFVELKRKHKAGYEFFRYKGEYDPDKSYTVFDVIRVMPGEDYTDEDGVSYLATPGVWICVVNVPAGDFTRAFSGDTNKFKRFLRRDDVDYFPQWPEPEDKANENTPDGRYWELLSLLPMEIVSCENGIEKKHFVDATPEPDPTEDDA